MYMQVLISDYSESIHKAYRQTDRKKGEKREGGIEIIKPKSLCYWRYMYILMSTHTC